MADTKPTIADSAAASERNDAPAPRHASSGTQVPIVSLDEMIAKDLGEDEEAAKPVRKQAKRAPSDEAEDEDHDEDEDEDSEPDDDEEQDSHDDSDADDSEDDEEEDADDSEAEDDSAEESDDDEEADKEEEDEPSDDSKKEPMSKGMEALAKDKSFAWAAKRIQKQSKDLNGLRSELAQGAIVLNPTTAFPLADATTEDKLRATVSEAKDQLKILSALKPTDFEENQEGEFTVVLKENGKRVVKTREEVEAEIKALEAKTDGDTITRQRQFNEFRQTNQPWKAAAEVSPELFQPGTPAHGFYKHVLALNPAMKATVGDYEMLIARAWRDMAREADSAPTKDFPKGRAQWVCRNGKWVRYALDKEGKLKTPKRADKEGEPRKPLLKRKPMTPPSGARPPQKQGSGGGRSNGAAKKADAERLMREKPSDAALGSLIAAELAGV